MIGPVQLMMIGMDAAEISNEICERVNRLRDSGAIGILDVLSLHKNRDGTMTVEQLPNLVPEPPHEPGALIGELMHKAAGAAITASSRMPSGRGFLMHASPVPDPKDSIPLGSTVLVLLLEHQWAIPLRDAVRDADAFPVSDAWLGREVLRDVGLIPQDA
jgi:hypothetical protein